MVGSAGVRPGRLSQRADDFFTLIALYLTLIAAVTLPHAVIVHWMDVTQGVWSVKNQHRRRA